MPLDTDRLQRQGFPEVVYGRGKTRQQMIDALTGLHQAHGHALATRVEEDLQLPGGHYDPASKLYCMGHMSRRAGRVMVISAGTADHPVAEEAAQTLEYLGYQPERITDIGVAGLHRLLDRLDHLRTADLLIVVAGMEGALPSVIGGLLPQPIIAVPTSTGYGTGAHGIAAILGMLNSCASGLTVVNIDNGFGAALAAHRILGIQDS
jgi:pyridinium-3,5-biscarboxylic acid mononucleotide synthase